MIFGFLSKEPGDQQAVAVAFIMSWREGEVGRGG